MLPDKRYKVDANLLYAERGRNPCATLQQLGNQFGVTKERVRQLLEKAGLPTRKWVQHYFICNNCRKKYYFGSSNGSKKFCSPQCKHEYYYPTLVCEECSQEFRRRLGEIRNNLVFSKQQHIFCSRRCFGKWVGRNFGFTAHPENTRKGSPRKWDYETVYKLRNETGWGAVRLSRALNIPEPTVVYILRSGKI